MVTAQVPDRGDLIWLEFNPQAGHEQAKRRPALALSPRRYNRISQLAVPRDTAGPFEVTLPAPPKTQGIVQADQVCSLDWKACKRERIVTRLTPYPVLGPGCRARSVERLGWVA
jgi:mRNA interferase MazF